MARQLFEILSYVSGVSEPDVHHNIPLERWIVEDAENYKRESRDAVGALWRAAGMADSLSAGAQIPLIDVCTNTGIDDQILAVPVRIEQWENGTDRWTYDASPSAKPSALTKLRTALAQSPTSLRGLLSLRAPYLENVPASFRDSVDRDLIAQLPDWMKLGPRNVKYRAGRLENGCYLIQIPGQLAMHLDVERKMHVPLGGLGDTEIITGAAKRAIVGV
ncbi:hypothetical protein B0A48_10461 [Cryoendolithus antarcticus]|uniref:Uncharacterized protein n=1 Tax=Cryoendolithus antarcticus TaxID=1507870 RepID=A0A1V8SXN3_9PEZI|nr:hypothetical protein B0A48_10461 [Cryoendolithus antarcticus]